MWNHTEFSQEENIIFEICTIQYCVNWKSFVSSDYSVDSLWHHNFKANILDFKTEINICDLRIISRAFKVEPYLCFNAKTQQKLVQRGEISNSAGSLESKDKIMNCSTQTIPIGVHFETLWEQN